MHVHICKNDQANQGCMNAYVHAKDDVAKHGVYTCASSIDFFYYYLSIRNEVEILAGI